MGESIDIYDFGGEYSQIYAAKCDCGKVIKVSTQEYRNPEYTTSIYIKCDCGKSVYFELPVN